MVRHRSRNQRVTSSSRVLSKGFRKKVNFKLDTKTCGIKHYCVALMAYGKILALLLKELDFLMKFFSEMLIFIFMANTMMNYFTTAIGAVAKW